MIKTFFFKRRFLPFGALNVLIKYTSAKMQTINWNINQNEKKKADLTIAKRCSHDCQTAIPFKINF